MKKGIILIILTVFSLLTFAQDLIVKNDGTEIEAIVIEVHDSEIHYKKFNNQEGPTYLISTATLTEIRYQSGDIEQYDIVSEPYKKEQIVATSSEKVNSEEITVRSGQYYFQGRQISTKKVKQLFAQHNSEEAISMWIRSNMNQGFSYAANVISYPVVLLSYFTQGSFILISVGGYIISAGLQVAHYALKTLYANQRLEAVELYNADIKYEQQHFGDDYY
tara:strand:+ start:200 stop:859 length:660 start_codon:yes stop_codon:yes gene_type:complete